MLPSWRIVHVLMAQEALLRSIASSKDTETLLLPSMGRVYWTRHSRRLFLTSRKAVNISASGFAGIQAVVDLQPAVVEELVETQIVDNLQARQKCGFYLNEYSIFS